MSQRDRATPDCIRDGFLRSAGLAALRQVRPTEAIAASEPSPWLTVKEAARRARCGVKTIYREVKAERLRAARVGGRRELRLRPEWVDEWLRKTTTPTEVAA